MKNVYHFCCYECQKNLRILGNWVNLYRSGKTQYLKKYRKNTWLQILKHVEHLRFWDLRELFEEIYNKKKNTVVVHGNGKKHQHKQV